MIKGLDFTKRRPFLVIAVAAACVMATYAQEGEPIVVDEVIAQVNSEVITLSQVKREMNEAIEAMKGQGASEQQATEEVSRRRAELIAGLIKQQLLIQKGKELGFAEEVEAEVNKRMLEVAAEQGIKTIEGLDTAMRAAGVDPVTVRQRLRSEIMKEFVLNREVDAKIYFSLSPAEIKRYYDANREKFRKPETVTLSEIWLSLAGRNEADVRALANQILAKARAGEDFGALAVAYSEREQAGVRISNETKGKVGTFQVQDLRTDIADAIKNVRGGQVAEPLRSDEGYQILRVDERIAAADAAYNESQVREAITVERRPKQRAEYLANLQKEAYLKISDGYRGEIEPLLKNDPKPAPGATGNTPPASNNRP